MKIQYLMVIFIIIILPISITLSTYQTSQIKAIITQNSYDAALHDATYDLVKAFQINTVNNKFSTISDSKIRDIEAAVNTFYNTLGSSLGASGYDKNTVKYYTPAILFNLYDGYYIYSKYKNEGNGKVAGADGAVSGVGETGEPQDGLKPYVYYSARYKHGTDIDVVINYTLDNYITVMGIVPKSGGGTEYVTRSGYLVNTNANGVTEVGNSMQYKGVTFDKTGEELEEFLVILDENGQIDLNTSKEYKYSMYNSQKIYFDADNASDESKKYFIYNKYQKAPIGDKRIIDELDARTNGVGEPNNSISAYEYYKSAYEFTKWVNATLGTIEVQDIVDSNGSKTGNYEDINGNTVVNYHESLAYTLPGNTNIFNTTNADNDPMVSDSYFNEHRKAVIRKSIEENLVIAMSNFTNFNDETEYDYAMPKLSEIDWDKIVNNISVLTFLQGIPMRYKFYNNYVVVPNNKNQELVDNTSIYIIDEVHHIYHKPGCTELLADGSLTNLKGYSNIDFLRQTAKQTENSPAYYFYPKCNTRNSI